MGGGSLAEVTHELELGTRRHVSVQRGERGRVGVFTRHQDPDTGFGEETARPRGEPQGNPAHGWSSGVQPLQPGCASAG